MLHACKPVCSPSQYPGLPPTLFEQLGLPAGAADIEYFIANHRLADGQHLHEAEFWTPQQAGFLRDGLAEDANWVDAIHELNVRLSA